MAVEMEVEGYTMYYYDNPTLSGNGESLVNVVVTPNDASRDLIKHERAHRKINRFLWLHGLFSKYEL